MWISFSLPECFLSASRNLSYYLDWLLFVLFKNLVRLSLFITLPCFTYICLLRYFGSPGVVFYLYLLITLPWFTSCGGWPVFVLSCYLVWPIFLYHITLVLQVWWLTCICLIMLPCLTYICLSRYFGSPGVVFDLYQWFC